MAKNKSRSRKSIRAEAARFAAENAQREALLAEESAKGSQNGSAAQVVQNAASLKAINTVVAAGWRVADIDTSDGYTLLVEADGACEQLISARTGIRLYAEAKALGTPDLYPAMVEYDVEPPSDELCETEAAALLATLGTEPSRSQVVMIGIIAFANKPVLVNGVSRREAGAAFDAAHRHYAEVASVAPFNTPTWGVLAQPTVMLFDDGRPTVAQEIDRRAEFNARHTRACPIEDLAADLAVDPISGAYVAPTGKTIQFSNTRLGLSHEQVTIGARALVDWIRHGWSGCLVTSMAAAS